MEILNTDIARVYDTNDFRDANNFLKCGWVLIGRDHYLSDGEPCTHYCMAWLKSNGAVRTPDLTQTNLSIMDAVL